VVEVELRFTDVHPLVRHEGRDRGSGRLDADQAAAQDARREHLEDGNDDLLQRPARRDCRLDRDLAVAVDRERLDDHEGERNRVDQDVVAAGHGGSNPIGRIEDHRERPQANAAVGPARRRC
jgi:hypothetical protein